MLWWSYSAGKLINNHRPHEYGWNLINISHSHILKRHTTKFIIYSYNKSPHIWKTYLGYKFSITMDVQPLEEFPLRSGTAKDTYWDHCYWWCTLWRSWPGWLWKIERLKHKKGSSIVTTVSKWHHKKPPTVKEFHTELSVKLKERKKELCFHLYKENGRART